MSVLYIIISLRTNGTTVQSLYPSSDMVSRYALGILSEASVLIYTDVKFYNCHICINYRNRVKVKLIYGMILFAFLIACRLIVLHTVPCGFHRRK